MSPESKNPEPVRSEDPLAELMRPEVVHQPRAVFRDALRDDLMRRPPVAPAPWQTLPGPAATVAALSMILALGAIGLMLRDRAPETPVAPPAATATAALQEVPAEPEDTAADPSILPSAPSRPPLQPDAGLPSLPGASGEEPDAQQPVMPSAAQPPAGSAAGPIPTTAPPFVPSDPEEDEEEQVPPTASATATVQPEPTGIVFDDPTPGPTETPPVSSGRPTSAPPTATRSP